jgi:dipeptidyl aminopeptidase/acylaminoacyl peptidase
MLVPLLTGLTHKSGSSPAGSPTPAAPTKGPVSGAMPSIPYTVTLQNNPDNPLDTWWTTLYDHGKAIKNPGTHGNVLGRFGDGGWLIETGYPKSSQLAVLDSAGQVRPLGPPGLAARPVYSADHQQLAVTLTVGKGTPQFRSRIVVLEVATGKQLASLDPPAKGDGAVAWTEDGIFLADYSHLSDKATLWQPGKGRPRELVGIQNPIFLRAVPATGKLLDYTTKGCARIGVLRDDTFVAEHEYCGTPDPTLHSVPSPNGRTLFSSEKKVAIDLYTGATTALKLPGQIDTAFSATVFEDPTNLIVVSDVSSTVQNMYRCSVATGECKVLRTAKSNEALGAVTP